ncbi:MAG: rhodanese-like domain-containing protein [Beijerinckiaceae bacterium]
MTFQPQRVKHLDIADVKQGIADGSMLVIDVREPHEFAMGHIPGALSLPLSSFHPSDIPQASGRRVVFSCAAGIRSVQALALAQGAGLALTEHYRGGFKDWLMAGERVEE